MSLDHRILDDTFPIIDIEAINVIGELEEETLLFKNGVLSYLDSLESRIEELLKWPDKVTERKLIKSLRKKVNWVSDNQFVLAMIRTEHLEDALKWWMWAVKDWEIWEKDFLLHKKRMLKPTGNPLYFVQQEFDRIEKKLKAKRSISQISQDSKRKSNNFQKDWESISLQSIIKNFKDWLSVSRTPEEKIWRIQTRVANILTVGSISSDHILEFQKMESRLREIPVEPNTALADLSSGLLEIIQELLSEWADGESFNIIPKTIIDQSLWEISESDIFPTNLNSIEYIRYIRSQVITFKDSSKKWWESLGDGNFIAHVWRPFLSRLEFLLKNNSLNSEAFSWSIVVKMMYDTQDGIDNRKRLKAFLDLLRNLDSSKNWNENWNDLFSAVESYSQNSNFFISKPGITPLKNILDKLIQNLPSSR